LYGGRLMLVTVYFGRMWVRVPPAGLPAVAQLAEHIQHQLLTTTLNTFD